MSWRTVIVSSHSKLDLQVGFLQIRDNEGLRRIILDEIDMLIVESTAVSVTAALLAELVDRKVKVVFCDRQRNPTAELVPCHGCHDRTRRLRIQLEWDSKTKQLVWRRIVVEKIRNQEKLLRRVGAHDAARLLSGYAGNVLPGDTTNREGLAAKVYFGALFGSDFTREGKCDVNSSLDYGYQVMLSVFTRELSCEGYLTELGIFHDNVYNNFNLASDLIEPLRPFVDDATRAFFMNTDETFCKETKRALVKLLYREVRFGDNRVSLVNAIVQYTRSVTDALSVNNPELVRFPEFEC